MKMSKVGNQTNSQDPQAVNSRVFVGNLNTFQCSKTDVERMFQRYGRLVGEWCSSVLSFFFLVKNCFFLFSRNLHYTRYTIPLNIFTERGVWKMLDDSLINLLILRYKWLSSYMYVVRNMYFVNCLETTVLNVIRNWPQTSK